jgi:uncharacterized protein YvpB
VSEAPSVRQRKMLSHSVDPRRRLHPAQSQPGRSSPSRTQLPTLKLDAISIALASLFVVGLVGLGLGIWLIFALPRQGQVAGQQAPGTASSLRTVDAEQTREAQGAEISRLREELGSTRQELATVTAARAVATTMPAQPANATVLDRPPLAIILDAPVYKQAHSLSCESSAAAMAMNYFGVGIGEETILAALPRHDNPHHGFRGDVDGPYGGTIDYGVYAEPMRQVLVRWGLQADHLAGGIDEISAHIRQGKVVIAWITYDLQVQSPRQVTTSDGQIVTLVPYEHAVLITGYNRNGLWVNDPFSGTQTFYPESDFSRSFAYLGNMALVIGPPAGP